MREIHILRGRGENCSCTDCPVMYGGDCYTTPINNILNKMEEGIEKYLSFTPTGRKRKVSSFMVDSAIEKVIKPIFLKYNKKSKVDFYSKYYSFLPLIYLMTSDKKKESYRMYLKARYYLFRTIEDNYNLLKD